MPHNSNAHTSIVVRNQINIINNGTNNATTAATKSQAANAKSQQISAQPMSSGNSRSKVSSRKASQMQTGANKQN